MKVIVWHFFLFLTSLGTIMASCVCAPAMMLLHAFPLCVCVLYQPICGCLHALAVENSAAIHNSRGACIFFELLFLGLCPGVGLLDHVIILILVF